MKIGILQVGKVADDLLWKYDEFPPMFQDLLGDSDKALSFHSFMVLKGDCPVSPHQCDAWLITGSARGVYDDDPWIAKMRTFVKRIRDAGRPLVGICFGHQLMAEAFGGKAGLSEKGWGCGVHDYEILNSPSWMSDAPQDISLHAMHQDQVTHLPDDATVHARNAFCEHAMVSYGDPENPDAFSIQPHPEFDREFAEDLVKARIDNGVIPQDRGEVAMNSFGRPVDNATFARWILGFFEHSLQKRANAA